MGAGLPLGKRNGQFIPLRFPRFVVNSNSHDSRCPYQNQLLLMQQKLTDRWRNLMMCLPKSSELGIYKG